MKHKFYFVMIFTALLLTSADTWAQNVAKYVVRAAIPKVPLTFAERSLLPLSSGKVAYELDYSNLGKATVLPAISHSGGWMVEVGHSQKMFIQGPLKKYVPYLYQLSIGASLSKADFPDLWQRNDNMLKHALQNSIRQLALVHSHDALFYSSLRSKVVDGTVPYHKYLPATGLDYVYVGEVHYNPLVQKELLRLLKVIQTRYPTRHIYLATEYAYDTHSAATLQDKLPLLMARNQNELRLLLDNHYEELPFLQEVIENKIPVVGLEPYTAMKAEAVKQTGVKLPDDIYLQHRRLSLSEAGIKMRNDRWAEHVAQIRAQDPQALVVIHGGGFHTSLHNLFAVPHTLKGNFFSVMLLDWRGRDTANPLLAKLQDQTFIGEQFVGAEEGKYILSFKDPNPSVGRTPELLKKFKEALGADLVIVMDNLSPLFVP